MGYELCKICKEVNANPKHVRYKHGMSWSEYQQSIKDEDFMGKVEEHRQEREDREEKEYHLSRLLMYHWLTKPTSLLRVMRRYVEHAKGNKGAFVGSDMDLSEFDGMDDAIVESVHVADAMTKSGWECVMARGGRLGVKKEYVMKRIK
jgi:hypothetical protein